MNIFQSSVAYLMEILRAKRDNKRLPGATELIKEHARWKMYLADVNVFKNAIPWITFRAIDFLENYLRKDMRVFEFGGGGSTLFFATRVKELVTTEHDKDWFGKLEREMKKYTAFKWDGKYVPPEDDSTANLQPGNPDHYSSGDERFLSSTFRKYAASIDQFPDDYFDVVLVDGRARPSCIMHSIRKVKRNGLLILDNADRPRYAETLGLLSKDFRILLNHFGPTPYATNFTQTNIWQRVR